MSRRDTRKQQRERHLGRKLRNTVPRALPAPHEPDDDVHVPYAKRYERNFDPGVAVAWLMSRPEFQETIGAECDVVESERSPYGPEPSYSTRELEAALFYQVMLGIRTWKAAREKLAGDTGGRSRAALHFDIARETRCPDELVCMAGIPSGSTMSRHRKRFPWERRLDVYRAYFDRLRRLNALDPELRLGLRILGIDGTAQPSSLTCPKINKDTGEIVNASRITCPTGGYRTKGDEKVHGFAVVPLLCLNELPWAYDHGGVNMEERAAAYRTVEDFRDNVLPYTGPRFAGVFTADSGFHDQVLRPLVQSIGYVPNIHSVSHAEHRPSTESEKAEAARLEFDLAGRPGWYVDGFRELHHRCGNPVHTYRKIEQVGERVVLRTDGECKDCKKTITITAGTWRKVKDKTRAAKDPRGQSKFVPMHKTDPDSVREWDLGNPFSYHDELAAQYGDMRFGHGEGFNGSAVKRFKLFKTKAHLENDARAELHCVMVFCIMHGLTQRRRELEAVGEFDFVPRPKKKARTEAGSGMVELAIAS